MLELPHEEVLVGHGLVLVAAARRAVAARLLVRVRVQVELGAVFAVRSVVLLLLLLLLDLLLRLIDDKVEVFVVKLLVCGALQCRSGILDRLALAAVGGGEGGVRVPLDQVLLRKPYRRVLARDRLPPLG